MIVNSDTSGLENLRLRIEEAKMLLPGILTDTAQIAGDAVSSALGNAAPIGKSESSSNPPGDAPGPLSESFSSEASGSGEVATVTVTCDQPQKLKWVTEGRGEVLPINKLALFWPGLPHPVRRAGPSEANDFISPILDDVDTIVEPEILAAVDVLSGILEGA